MLSKSGRWEEFFARQVNTCCKSVLVVDFLLSDFATNNMSLQSSS